MVAVTVPAVLLVVSLVAAVVGATIWGSRHRPTDTAAALPAAQRGSPAARRARRHVNVVTVSAWAWLVASTGIVALVTSQSHDHGRLVGLAPLAAGAGSSSSTCSAS